MTEAKRQCAGAPKTGAQSSYSISRRRLLAKSCLGVGAFTLMGPIERALAQGVNRVKGTLATEAAEANSGPAAQLASEVPSAALPISKLPRAIRASAHHWGVPFEGIALDVRDLSTGRTLLSFQPDRSHAPASTAKLFTTLAALERLTDKDEDFRFETKLYRRIAGESSAGVSLPSSSSPDSSSSSSSSSSSFSSGAIECSETAAISEDGTPALILVGGGDPGFTATDLEVMLSELMASGVMTIEGDILLDRSYFPPREGVEPKPMSRQYRRSGWEQRWRVGPDAMTIGDRCVRLTFTPDGKDHATVSMSPVLEGIDWQKTVSLRPGRCVDWDDRLELEVLRLKTGGRRIVFRGGFFGACGKETLYLSLEDADAFAERCIRSIWRSLGGEWRGRLRSTASSEGEVLLSSGRYELVSLLRSNSVPELVRAINKDSINPAAESLFLSLSEARTAEASGRVLEAWLDGKDISHMNFVPGAGDGLDGSARVDARLMGDLLAAAYRSERKTVWKAFFESLPVVGVDGTMKRRGLPGVKASVKSGTLATTRALAGYVEHRSGRLLSVYGAVWGESAMPGARAFLDGVLLWAAGVSEAEFK